MRRYERVLSLVVRRRVFRPEEGEMLFFALAIAWKFRFVFFFVHTAIDSRNEI